MFSQPNLSQSQQPNAHYDYDGLSGSWLRLPWWIHIAVAMLAWPFSWWILPMFPVKNPNISEFLVNYRIQIAAAISILTIMTALLSYLKARKIQNRKTTKKVASSAQKNIKPVPSRKTHVEDEKPKTKKNSASARKTASKTTNAQVAKKPTVKKAKTTIKKKSDQQTRLDF